MSRPPSLTLRLTLLFGFAAAIVFSGFGWIIERSVENHFHTEDAAELELIASAVSQALTTWEDTNKLTALEQRFYDILLGHHGAVLYVTKAGGNTVFTSLGGPDLSKITSNGTLNDKNNGVYNWSDSEHTYRVLTRSLSYDTATGRRTYRMSIAVAIDYHLRFLDGFYRTTRIMIISGIVVMGLMGWIAVRRGHLPLHSIVNQIRSISASDLHTRLSPATVPRELTDLAVSFNEMLERMENSFQRLSNFSDDIAHELRTPMTNLLTQTQVALTKTRNVDEYREILYSNMEEYERMAQMISDMLFLAKADNGLFQLEKVEVDLAIEVQELFDYYEAWADECGVTLSLDGNAKVPGDKLMLRRVLSNLISNAIRHTPKGKTVKVHLDRVSDNKISIIVENPGVIIASEHIPKIFDRFYRVDAARQREGEGAGLGLAIVKSIVDLHHGTIEANSVVEGTQFHITLPDKNPTHI